MCYLVIFVKLFNNVFYLREKLKNRNKEIMIKMNEW